MNSRITPRNLVRALCAAALLGTAASAQSVGLVNSVSLSGPGMDFVEASWTTRTLGVGQGCPFLLKLPALPAGATEVASYAAWNFLDSSGPIGPDTIAINGVVVNGAHLDSTSPGLCSIKSYGDTFLADITGLVNPGQINLVDGVCDKLLYADPNALGSGVTLITVYQFSNGPDRGVDLFSGFISTIASTSGNADATLQMVKPYHFGDLHFAINAIGGDLGVGDGFKINGTGVAGSLPGTNAPGDAWIGALGPLANDNKYDVADGDISAQVASGDLSFDVRTVGLGDCIGHTFAAVSHQIECGDVLVYCTAKVNSLGCTPTISTTGKPSASSGLPFKIRASNLINNKNGLLFYGLQSASIPFQGGFLCVKPPIRRTGVQSSNGNPPPNDCSGVYSFDFNGLIAAGTDPNLVPGAKVFAQYWSRDPQDAFTTSLSDAVGFDICPH